MSEPHERTYEFGPFRLDARRRTLLRDGRHVAVTAKVFDTLLALVERRGQVVSKNELMDALWPDTAVEENNLTQHVSTLRKILGERAGDHRYVVTLPGRGYSFVAPVTETNGSDATNKERANGAGVNNGVASSNGDAEDSKHESLSVVNEAVGSVKAETSAPAFASSNGRPAHVEVTNPNGPRTRDAKPRRETAFASMPRRKVVFVATAALVALVALPVSVYYARRAHGPSSVQTPNASRTQSIAVLPFRSLSPDPADEYIGSGMADALIARLSNVRQIAVRPTSAVIKYAGRDRDTAAAGRALGVDAVLEGTIQKSGDRLRVTVQLVGVRDQRPLWAQSFDERFTDIFSVQDSISEQVARAMLLELNGEERRLLRRHGTENVEAFQAYLRGRHFWNKRNEEGLTKSVEHFQRAIDLDPAYAQAYAGLADAYNVLANYHFGPLTSEECFRRSKWAVTRALEIDDTLAEAHASLALVKTYFERDDAAAETSYRRAIELNPSYATAHHWYSDFLAFRGRDEEALAEILRAAELDPLSPIISTTLAERFYFARRYDDCVTQLRRTLDLEADFIQARFYLGLAYEQQGLYEQAIAELRRARELSNNKTDSILAALGHAYAAAGRREEARRVLDELLARDPAAPYEVALLFASLGQRDHAFDWLRKARDKAATQAATQTMLHTDPRLDRLRSDPKFQPLFGA